MANFRCIIGISSKAHELNLSVTLYGKSHYRFSVMLQAIISNYQDLLPPEFENYFCYAAMWAFGGTLVEEHRPYFSQWWKEQWSNYVLLPGDEEVGSQSKVVTKTP